MIKVRTTLTDTFSKQLATLGQGINSHVVRSTARAGALEYYNTLMKNVPVGPTSNLKNSLYHAYADNVSTKNYKEYQVGFRGNYGNTDKNDEQMKLGSSKHLHLVEFGHIQRYQMKVKKDGTWVTLVRPSKIGTARPNPKSASQTEMDAYYIPLKTPIQRQGSGFVRRSFDEAKNLAPAAMAKRATERLAELINNPSLASTYVS